MVRRRQCHILLGSARESLSLSFYVAITGHDYDGAPLHKQAVLTQASSSSPWLVSYVGAYVNGTAVFGGAASNEIRQPLAVPTDPRAIPQKIAAFFQALDETGSLPPIPAGLVEDGIVKAGLSSSLQLLADRSAAHFSDHFTHTIDSVSAVYPGSGDTSAIVCDAVRMTDVVTPAPGASILQSADRHDWGNQLAPGDYGSLTITVLHDECYMESTDGSIRQLIDMPGVLSLTGTPAKPGTTPQPGDPTTPIVPNSTNPNNDVGQPGNGLSAVVALDTGANRVILDTGGVDVTYKACPSMNLATLAIGDFIEANINRTTPCSAGATVLAAPQPPQCQSVGYDGQVTGAFTAYNNAAHTIVHRRSDTGGNQPLVALRWCDPPTVVGTDGSAEALCQITPGSTVQITFAGGMQGPWLQSLVVQK